jgi:hypothetical protein
MLTSEWVFFFVGQRLHVVVVSVYVSAATRFSTGGLISLAAVTYV